MKVVWRRIAALAVAGLAIAGEARAQLQTGNLYGTVIDERGAALPGATLTLSGSAAPLTQAANAEGQFRFLGLSPGTYRLQAELSGFSSAEYSEVVIGVGRNTTLEITLSAAVEETITVTTSTSLLDERAISTGTSLTQLELDKVPSSRDPWGLLAQTPGVQVDRINVGGNESGQQSVYVGRGANSDANTWAVDGVDITDMASISSPTYFDFDAFEELQVTTGGSDVTTAASGVTVNVVTKRGSNDWRGSGRILETDGSWQSDPSISDGEAGRNFNAVRDGQRFEQTQNLSTYLPNSIDDVKEYGGEAGGPLWRDHLWLWAAYGKSDINNLVNGQNDSTLLENSNGKLNFQLGQSNSGIAQWSRGDKIKSGRGAGSSRAPETTEDQSGPTDVSKIEDTQIFGSSFYVTGLYSLVDGGFQLIPKGGLDADVWADADGVYHGSYYFLINNRDVTQYRVDASSFIDGSRAAHELRFGAGYREAETDSLSGFSRQKVNYDCAVNGCLGVGDTQATFFRDAATSLSTEYTQAWFQDTLTAGRLTANLGLRWEEARGSNLASGAGAVVIAGETVIPALQFAGDGQDIVTWQTLLPRLGLTWSLGEERHTLVRANYSRFAEQLPQGYIAGPNPVGTSTVTGEFIDANHNTILDPAEFGSFVRTSFAGWDPSNPNSLVSPNQVDPDLSPALTDEVNLAFDHALRPEFVFGAGLTLRKVSNLPELQELVVDDATGEARVTQRDDYLRKTRVVPGGTSAAGRELEWFELRPGLTRTGGTRLASGDRSQDYWGVNLNLTKRLSNRWMARGSVVYSDWTWNVPASYFDHHNPTDFGNGSGVPGFGARFGDGPDGNRDGEAVAEVSSGSGSKGDVLLNSNWSFSLTGLYQVAPDRPWGFDLSGAVHGRQGYPDTLYRNVTGADGISRSVQWSDDVDSERLADVISFDLRLEKDIALGPFGAVISLEGFNLFNNNTVLQRERNQGLGTSNYVKETVSPRAVRLGLRLRFDAAGKSRP